MHVLCNIISSVGSEVSLKKMYLLRVCICFKFQPLVIFKFVWKKHLTMFIFMYCIYSFYLALKKSIVNKNIQRENI